MMAKDHHTLTRKELKMNKIAYKKLYTAANTLMADVGLHGEIEINTMDDRVCNIMDALFEIDGGAFDNEVYGFVEVKTKYKGE